ncbi:MAG: AraC family transcriptional regulator [Gammaproteobacteria bacterium]|jgi:AraC-like DNA-binding protein
MATTSTTLTSWALLIWKALQAHGCDSYSIFKQVGLDPDKLGDGNARYRLEEMTKLWNAAVEATGDPCFGLEAGKRWAPTSFHALGFAWLASYMLKDALQRLVRYTRIVNNSLNAELEERGMNLHLTIESSEEAHDIHYAAVDATIAAIMVMCRMLCGEDFTPVEVRIAHAPSRCREPLERFVGAPVVYGADRGQIVFDRMHAEKPLGTGNSELAQMNEELVIKYLVKLDRSSMVMQVKAQLLALLPEGAVSEETVAKQLNISLRSLQRKLRDERTNFSAIYDAMRREMAGTYIQDSQMSMTEIAYLLGFSDQANFTRAFRRWYGHAPSEARKNLQKVSLG